MASLLELQRSFGAALRGGADSATVDDAARACGLEPPANLSIYRHNSDHAFRSALEIGFPVLRRRVGDDYFRQLAHHYRVACPSRSGDLHWAGQDFSVFLAEHLRGGDYAWLADLARLEWGREAAAVCAELPALGADALRKYPAEMLEHLTFTLQPSLRLVESPFPVFSVWFANQGENASPVDQSAGRECGMIRLRSNSMEVTRLAPDLFSCMDSLVHGATLGEAVTAANVGESRLIEVLGFLFSSSLVSSLTPAPGRRQGTSS